MCSQDSPKILLLDQYWNGSRSHITAHMILDVISHYKWMVQPKANCSIQLITTIIQLLIIIIKMSK